MAVSLREIPLERFGAWRDKHLAAAQANFEDRLGLAPADARRRAEAEVNGALPDGFDTNGMHIMELVDSEGVEVGSMWVGPHPRRPDALYVYDIEIAPEHRGRGLGRSAMEAAEAWARCRGDAAIGLSVSAANVAARRLYASLGYRETTIAMLKLTELRPEIP